MSQIDQVEQIIMEKSLLKHPFYQMWSKGELNQYEISGYSKEYFQLVKIIPELVRSTGLKTSNPDAKRVIEGHAREEEQHIELWRRFATSLGISRSELDNYSGSAKTREAVSSLLDLESRSTFGEAVAALYAFEWELPKISKSKLDGLAKFYGLTSTDATIYFETHCEADVRHAATWREFLPGENPGDVARAATESIDAQNRLLDSVMESYVPAKACA